MSEYKISSSYNDTPVEVQWTDNDLIRTLCTYQLNSDYWQLDPGDPDTPYVYTFTNDQMISELEAHLAVRLERYGQYLINNDVTKIISVGPGMSTFEAAVAKLNPNCHICLVDKSEVTYPDKFSYEESPLVFGLPPGYAEWGFRNSYDAINDVFSTSGIDSARYSILDPSENWSDADVVISIFSWMWEYPKETYWEKAMQGLKTGGKLICTLKFIPDRDVAAEITAVIGSQPVVIPWLLENGGIPTPYLPSLTVVDGVYGGVYVWTKTT